MHLSSTMTTLYENTDYSSAVTTPCSTQGVSIIRERELSDGPVIHRKVPVLSLFSCSQER